MSRLRLNNPAYAQRPPDVNAPGAIIKSCG